MLNIDTIIAAAIRSLGLDPVQTRNQLVALQNWVIESVKKFDFRLSALESDRLEMHSKLDRILQLLEKPENESVILEKEHGAAIHAISDGRAERVAIGQ